MTLGFIGQGWIGKNLANHFEERGFDLVRYANEAPHNSPANKSAIAECPIVFIAVPTPTTPQGFDPSIIRSVLPLVGRGNIAVIKSTVLPGTTDKFAEEFPDIYVLHGPEFLRETSVRQDIDHPDRNIIGIPGAHYDEPDWRKKADEVIGVLPDSPYEVVCRAAEAELTKYGGNNFLALKVVFMNLLYDVAKVRGADWGVIAENMKADPRIGGSHMQPVHQYDHMGESKTARGAGGHCFIKDLAALRELYEREFPEDKEGAALFRAFEHKNNKLLYESQKDLDLLEGVYGKLGDDIGLLEQSYLREGKDIARLEKAYVAGDVAGMEEAERATEKELAETESTIEEIVKDLDELKRKS